MKKLLILLLLMTIASLTLVAETRTKGEVGIESRYFSNDTIEETKDSNIAQKARIEIRGNQNNFYERLRVFGRADTTDHNRGVVVIEEAWYGYEKSNLNIKAGAQMLNWTALEAFHPADMLNSRNLDSNVENAEKYGEPMLSLNYLLEGGSVGVYYMPVMIDPNLPKKTNRLRFASFDTGSAIWIEEDGSISADNRSDQFALRVDKTFGPADVSFHYLQHKDRSQPLLVLNSETTQFHPVYLPVKQVGGTLQYIISDFILKSEFAHRGFSKSTNTHLGVLDQKDHYQLAFGGEYTFYHSSGKESGLLIEAQTIQGVSKQERAALSLFQNDILLGHRFVFNDMSSSEFFTSLIVDLERSDELLFSFSYSQRLGDTWKIQPGLRLVKGRSHSDGYGLQQIAESDQVFINLTRYF
ncbi:hypothetical protein DID80_04240 [Candidatus Marinamargulisbacteria bacterium SCGC AAA071-K20]|nr:hypothetical protein DID80_04240 [Candidatus Marinamargulisbacteria bacterium SCGC AAA071-K20]